MTRPRIGPTPPEMTPEQEREAHDAREALWRFKLRLLARADGRAAHEPRPAPPPSRRGFLRAFLTEPAPPPNGLPTFLSGDAEG